METWKVTCGVTDEMGFHVAENPVTVYDFHVTILHRFPLNISLEARSSPICTLLTQI